MPANRFNGYTEYGIGIGLRVPHYQHIFQHKPAVDWFEIISENFMVDGGRPLQACLFRLAPPAGTPAPPPRSIALPLDALAAVLPAKTPVSAAPTNNAPIDLVILRVSFL